MAKRYTISLPDELARRIEPFKDQLSLSAIMQKSLEAELSELIRPDDEKAKGKALVRLAENFYKEDLSTLVKGVTAFIDHAIERAVQDSDLFVFRLYGTLQTSNLEGIDYQFIWDQVGQFVENFDDESQLDDTAHRAFWATYMGDQDAISEIAPKDRRWDDTDVLRIMKIVLQEKLNRLMGEEAIKSYLTWHSGYSTQSASLEHETDDL